ncbi:MAG: nucleotidyltransferase family protein [Bacteroidetes bacterium]|nr:MAG: nucleotidyltransferase family protein [Bacteroidota bacterium]
MKAMIFAAGLGTRLRPYTNDRPKALVEVGGQTLLAHNLLRMRKAGVSTVVINVHHFADMVEDHLASHDNFGLDVHISNERDLLLDTGGGLWAARRWLTDAPFLIHNVDILSDLDLRALYTAHQSRSALSTLAVRKRTTSRYLQFSRAGLLTAWYHSRTGERRISRPVRHYQNWAYSGIAVIDPALFAHFPQDKQTFSIIDVWLAAARKGAVRAYPHTENQWLDVGKPEALARAEDLVK